MFKIYFFTSFLLTSTKSVSYAVFPSDFVEKILMKNFVEKILIKKLSEKFDSFKKWKQEKVKGLKRKSLDVLLISYRFALLILLMLNKALVI